MRFLTACAVPFFAAATASCTGGFVTDAATSDGIDGALVLWQEWPETSYGFGGMELQSRTVEFSLQPGGPFGSLPGIYSNVEDGELTSPLLADRWYRVVVVPPDENFLWEGHLFYVDHRRDDSCPYTDANLLIQGSGICERQDFTLQPAQTDAVYDLRPDLIVDARGLEGEYESAPDFDHPYTQCVTVAGDPTVHKVLRASVTVANVGVGPLHLSEQAGASVQRVYRRNSSPRTVAVPGAFDVHPTHGHLHFDDWAQIRLVSQSSACDYWKERDPTCVIAAGEKISFCVMESTDFWEGYAWPDGPPGSEASWPVDFTDDEEVCWSTEQGMRPGRADTYGAHLPGQTIDLAAVQPGTYWLEAEVDPQHQFVERARDNNIVRLAVTIDGDCDDTLWCNPSGSYDDLDACLDFVD